MTRNGLENGFPENHVIYWWLAPAFVMPIYAQPPTNSPQFGGNSLSKPLVKRFLIPRNGGWLLDSYTDRIAVAGPPRHCLGERVGMPETVWGRPKIGPTRPLRHKSQEKLSG